MDKMKEDTRNCNLHPAHPMVTWVHPILGNNCHRSRGLIFGQGHGFSYPAGRKLWNLPPGPAVSGTRLPPESGCLPSRAVSRAGLPPEPAASPAGFPKQ